MLTDGSDKPMRLWRAISPVGCLLALLVIGAPLAGRAQETTPEIALTRLSFSSGWDALPAVVALERGFFAQEGVIVSGLAVSSAEAAINSLAAGSTDMAAVHSGLPRDGRGERAGQGRGDRRLGHRDGARGKPGAEIRSVADLKGKKVAVLQGRRRSRC
jgi:ABC-type nitrate/sulfonate/bicarbonate transport system substrate-binding protein